MSKSSLLCHASGVIPRGAVGFIGMFPLLVNNYYPYIFQGSKYPAARSYNYFCVAALYSPVFVGSLPHGKAAVYYCHGAPEKRAEASHHLRSQRYFRHKHQRRSAFFYSFVNKLDKNRSFAASRNPVKQSAVRLVFVHKLG